MSQLDYLREVDPELLGNLTDAEIVGMLSKADGKHPAVVAHDLGISMEGYVQNESGLQDAGTSLLLGASQALPVAGAVLDIFNPLTYLHDRAYASEQVDRFEHAVGTDEWRARQQLNFSPPAQEHRQNVDAAFEEGVLPGLGALVSNPRHAANLGLQSLPLMGMGAMGGRAAAGLAERIIASRTGLAPAVNPLIRRTAAYGSEGTVAGGSMMDHMLERDVEPSRAAPLSALGGAVVGGLGAAGGEAMRKLGLTDADVWMTGGGRAAEGAARLSYPKQVFGGTMGEAVQEAPQSMAEQFLTNVGTRDPLTQGLGRAGAEGFVVGGMVGFVPNAIPSPKIAPAGPQVDLTTGPDPLALPAPDPNVIHMGQSFKFSRTPNAVPAAAATGKPAPVEHPIYDGMPAELRPLAGNDKFPYAGVVKFGDKLTQFNADGLRAIIEEFTNGPSRAQKRAPVKLWMAQRRLIEIAPEVAATLLVNDPHWGPILQQQTPAAASQNQPEQATPVAEQTAPVVNAQQPATTSPQVDPVQQAAPASVPAPQTQPIVQVDGGQVDLTEVASTPKPASPALPPWLNAQPPAWMSELAARQPKPAPEAPDLTAATTPSNEGLNTTSNGGMNTPSSEDVITPSHQERKPEQAPAVEDVTADPVLDEDGIPAYTSMKHAVTHLYRKANQGKKLRTVTPVMLQDFVDFWDSGMTHEQIAKARSTATKQVSAASVANNVAKTATVLKNNGDEVFKEAIRRLSARRKRGGEGHDSIQSAEIAELTGNTVAEGVDTHDTDALAAQAVLMDNQEQDQTGDTVEFASEVEHDGSSLEAENEDGSFGTDAALDLNSDDTTLAADTAVANMTMGVDQGAVPMSSARAKKTLARMHEIEAQFDLTPKMIDRKVGKGKDAKIVAVPVTKGVRVTEAHRNAVAKQRLGDTNLTPEARATLEEYLRLSEDILAYRKSNSINSGAGDITSADAAKILDATADSQKAEVAAKLAEIEEEKKVARKDKKALDKELENVQETDEDVEVDLGERSWTAAAKGVGVADSALWSKLNANERAMFTKFATDNPDPKLHESVVRAYAARSNEEQNGKTTRTSAVAPRGDESQAPADGQPDAPVSDGAGGNLRVDGESGERGRSGTAGADQVSPGAAPKRPTRAEISARVTEAYPLLERLAKQAASKREYSDLSIEADDLLQEALFAATRAAERYDPAGEYKFADVALVAAKRAIKNYHLAQAREANLYGDESRGGTLTGATVEQVQQWLGRPLRSLGKWVSVQIVPDIEALRAEVGRQVGEGVRGMRHGSTIYLVANRLDAKTAREVFAHEVVGHLGLETVLGKDGFAKIMGHIDSILASGNKRLAEIAATVDREYPGLDPLTRNKEILAHLVERSPGFGLVQQIAAKVRAWLARHGIGDVRLAEIHTAIVDAARAVQRDDVKPIFVTADPQFSQVNASFDKASRYAGDHLRNGALNGALWVTSTEDLADLASLLSKDLGDKFKAVIDQMMRLASRQKHRIAEATKVAQAFAQLSETHQLQANKYLLDSTWEQMWGYKPDWDASVTAATVDPAFRTRFNALDPAVQEVIKAVNRSMAQSFTDKVALLDALAKAKGVKPPRLAKMKGPYAPIKRFGDHVVTGMSAQLVDAIKKAEAGQIKWAEVHKLRKDPDHYFMDFVDGYHAAKELERELATQFAETSAHKKAEWREHNKLGYRELNKVRTALVEGLRSSGGKGAASATAVDKMLVELELGMLSQDHSKQNQRQRRKIAGLGMDSDTAPRDMMKAFSAQAIADAHYLANLEHVPDLNAALYALTAEAEKGSSEARHQATTYTNELWRRYHAGLEYKPTPLQDKVVGFNAAWNLVLSPIYYIQNGLQNVMMTLPYIAKTFGYARTWGEFHRAYRDMSAMVQSAQFTTNEVFPFDVFAAAKNQKERDLLQWLLDRGRLDIALGSELGDLAGGGGNKAAAYYSRTLKRLPGMLETVNRVSTALTAYRLAQGQGEQAAMEYADRVIRKSHGNYETWNTPKLIDGNRFGGWGKVLFQYRKFQLIQGAYLFSLAHQAIYGEDAKGQDVIDDDTKLAAWKSLGFAMAHTLALAGTMGLPGVSALFFLYQLAGMAFGDDDEPYDKDAVLYRLRRGMEDLGFSPDMADLVLNGTPTILGTQITDQVGWANMLSWSPYTKVDTSDQAMYEKAVVGLMGPTAMMGKKLFTGTAAMFEGEYMRGLEKLAPNGVSNFAKLYRTQTEGETYRNGDQALAAEEFNAWHGMMTVLGFTPEKVGKRWQKQAVKTSYEGQYEKRTGEIKKRYAQASKARDSAAIRSLRKEWIDLQTKKRKEGLATSPLSALLRAPKEQAKREKDTAGGVKYDKGSKTFVRSVDRVY